MKIIDGLLLVAVLVIGTGCVSSAPEKAGVSATECSFAKGDKTYSKKCNAPKMGWEGANGSDFIIRQ